MTSDQQVGSRPVVSTTTGRWKLGLALALTSAFCWGILPIALYVALQALDPYTLTWYRFIVATVMLGAILAATHTLPALHRLKLRTWILLLLALTGILGNYILLLFALKYTTPTVVQVVGQLSGLFLLLGGVVIFKERFSSAQWLGFGIVLVGLTVFFNHRLAQLYDVSRGLGLGVAISVVTTLAWTAYGLTQRRLLRELRSSQILLVLYFGATFALLPVASPSAIGNLNALQMGMLGFSCLNTVIGYGAFAEALCHWNVSRVGAVLTTTPLFTLASMALTERFVPQMHVPEDLNSFSVLGALLVVSGAAACALAGQSQARGGGVRAP